jgi:hypothetical protein
MKNVKQIHGAPYGSRTRLFRLKIGGNLNCQAVRRCKMTPNDIKGLRLTCQTPSEPRADQRANTATAAQQFGIMRNCQRGTKPAIASSKEMPSSRLRLYAFK